MIETCQKYKALKEQQDKGEEIDEQGLELLAVEPVPVMPVFESKECEEKFDTENPEIVIPDEIVNEEDNDWVLSELELD